MKQVKTAAIVGGGVIGGGWAARLIANGIDVTVFDPAPDARGKFDAVLANAEHAYEGLGIGGDSSGSVSWFDSAAAAAEPAQLIIESVPERTGIKRAVYAEIESTASA
ncbi:MAG: 3-hydroxyacyl-CoA dehydrogenase NAD-binding domain-containing protein, partial [Gammaproteobacteria bacterium]